MPEIDEVRFDGSTQGVGPFFNQGDIIEHPSGNPGVWSVTKTRIHHRTKEGTATLEKVEFPTDDELREVKRWSPLEHRWELREPDDDTSRG